MDKSQTVQWCPALEVTCKLDYSWSQQTLILISLAKAITQWGCSEEEMPTSTLEVSTSCHQSDCWACEHSSSPMMEHGVGTWNKVGHDVLRAGREQRRAHCHRDKTPVLWISPTFLFCIIWSPVQHCWLPCLLSAATGVTDWVEGGRSLGWGTAAALSEAGRLGNTHAAVETTSEVCLPLSCERSKECARVWKQTEIQTFCDAYVFVSQRIKTACIR